MFDERLFTGKRPMKSDIERCKRGVASFLYKMAAQMGWRQMIRADGGRAKDL